MDFYEIVKSVIIDTGRPDMGPIAPFTFGDFVFPGGGDDRIPLRIASTCLSLHTMEFFYKDIVSAQVSLDAAQWIQNIDTTIFPRFRALSYFRKYDQNYLNSQINPQVQPPSLDSTGYGASSRDLNLLKIITPTSEIFDYFGAERTDVAYIVGTTLMAKSSTAFKQALVGYYAFPNLDWKTTINNVLAANFNSWIAKEYGQAVVDVSVSSIFATVGKQDQSRKYDDPRTGLVPMWRGIIRINNIVAEGY